MTDADVSRKGDTSEEPEKSALEDPLLREFYTDIEGKAAKEEEGEQNRSEPYPLDENDNDQVVQDADDKQAPDPKMNSSYQINRLLRPGATYINLNPFAVLEIDYDDSVEAIRKKYRKLSVLVHPDKNPEDKERAEKAFEAVNRAYKMLTDDAERRKCREVVDEARELVDKRRAEQKRRASRGKSSSSKHNHGDETDDDRETYEKEVWNMTIKLFADLERIRVKEEAKKAEERKRRAEEKTLQEELMTARKEWNKNYEESRDVRVSSWKAFQKKKKKVHESALFRPPAAKPETH